MGRFYAVDNPVDDITASDRAGLQVAVITSH